MGRHEGIAPAGHSWECTTLACAREHGGRADPCFPAPAQAVLRQTADGDACRRGAQPVLGSDLLRGAARHERLLRGAAALPAARRPAHLQARPARAVLWPYTPPRRRAASSAPVARRLVRQDTALWAPLHRGCLTTGQLNAALGFYEPAAARKLDVPPSFVGHRRLLAAHANLRLPLHRCAGGAGQAPRGARAPAAPPPPGQPLRSGAAAARAGGGGRAEEVSGRARSASCRETRLARSACCRDPALPTLLS